MADDPTVTYDDASSALKYSGTWSSSTWNDGLQNATMHVTTDLTASVSFKFPVAATAFSIFVVEQNVGGHCSICVDCAPNPQAITVVEAPLLPAMNDTVPPVLLFRQTFDAPGIHTVVLSNMLDPTTPGNSSLLALASFVLVVPQTAPPASLIAAPGTTTLVTPDTTTHSSATRTPLLNSTTRTSTTSVSFTSSESTASLSHSSTPSSAPSSSSPAAAPTAPTSSVSLRVDRARQLDAIIGGALGALALVCGLVFFICWRNRRRRRPTPRPRVTSSKQRRGAGIIDTPVLPVLGTPPASRRPSESAAGDASAATPPSPAVSMHTDEGADALATAALLSRRKGVIEDVGVGTTRQENRFDEDPPPYEYDDGVP